jgi:hypothetical protein
MTQSRSAHATQSWWERPSTQLIGASTVGPGLLGGVGVLLGLPALLVLFICAGAAGFFVAYPGGGWPRLSAYAGLGANLVALIVIGLPFAAALMADIEFRGAVLGVIGVIAPVVIVTLGVGAVVGYGGGWVGRDVARRNPRSSTR